MKFIGGRGDAKILTTLSGDQMKKILVGEGYRGLNIDKDGDIDVVISAYSGNSITILQNDGTASFTTSESIAVGNKPHQVIAADFDGDGDLDLATANDADNFVTLLINTTP